ncbi:MAG: EAL domain-containing protein, partial [Alphaproteobacteria bacterium]|nr:EAL domain-containing protein [Alphaproteobacteria bacterium]
MLLSAALGALAVLSLWLAVWAWRRRRPGASEALFQTLFESSPDPTWIIEGGAFVECNAAALTCLQYPDKSLFLKSHPSRLSPETQADGDPSFAKAERMMALARENGIHRFEWLHTRADGSCFPAEVTLSALTLAGREVIHCVWRDITERKRIEADMRLAASVLEGTSEGVIITDAQGVILSVNPAFTAITGYEPSEAIGATPRLLKSEHHDQAFYQTMWRSLSENGQWRGEVWNRRKSGEAYLEWLSITALPGRDGMPTRYVSLFTDVTELRRKDERIHHQAYHDALTGLPNRLLLGDRLTHAIEVARREERGLAVMFIDLDRFKVVNDSLGHDAGDMLLEEVARRLTACTRRSDTIARLGGDEFVVVLTGFENPAEVAEVAEKLIHTLMAPMALKGHDVNVGASIGISLFPEDGADTVTLMKNADTAMYRAKEAGRNTFRMFDRVMNSDALERLELEEALRRALERGEFELHYQPKIDLRSKRVVGAEALIRWLSPERGMVSPAQFIPLAEETGLIIRIGDWVLEEACRQLAAWEKQGLDAMKVAINVSARQFHDGGLADRVSEALLRHEVDPARLEIELTESTVMSDPDNAVRQLLRLREIGITVSIDDFGTGYSSLSSLKSLPLGTIKIDQSFVRRVDTDSDNSAIVAAIVGLAGALGMSTVAEGVETREEEALLEQYDCAVVQGFRYAKAMPAAEFEAWVGAAAETMGASSPLVLAGLDPAIH